VRRSFDVVNTAICPETSVLAVVLERFEPNMCILGAALEQGLSFETAHAEVAQAHKVGQYLLAAQLCSLGVAGADFEGL
jgi:hypothetical protein